MTEQTKAVLATVTIVACLMLIGAMAYLRVEGAGIAAVSVVGVIVAWLTRTPDRKDPPAGLSCVPIVAAGALLAAIVACGCSTSPPALNVENAAAIAQYEAMLIDCRNLGKQRNSYDVYEACADRVDADLCTKHGLRCKDGGK